MAGCGSLVHSPVSARHTSALLRGSSTKFSGRPLAVECGWGGKGASPDEVRLVALNIDASDDTPVGSASGMSSTCSGEQVSQVGTRRAGFGKVLYVDPRDV